ncbi:hypothetical protein HYS96_00630 [Candidatus Daviesbacteria bacterium]|nr:hypothetical protein [Candidatus Daviesbacteria bacterium]
MNNPCVRCSKQRIDGKTWKEKVGISIVTYTMTICPDSTCQKLVDKAIAERQEKNDLISKKKIAAKLERERAVAVS